MKRLRLYLMVGYPGAGKTTVAKVIAETTGAVHLWADHERRGLFGQPTHSPEETKQLYDQLNARTDELLGAGRSVVFDTNFGFRHDRDLLRNIAARYDADTVVVWLVTPKEIAKNRAVADHNLRNGYECPMPPEDFERIASHLESPAQDENFIKIDGTKIDKENVKQLLQL